MNDWYWSCIGRPVNGLPAFPLLMQHRNRYERFRKWIYEPIEDEL